MDSFLTGRSHYSIKIVSKDKSRQIVKLRIFCHKVNTLYFKYSKVSKYHDTSRLNQAFHLLKSKSFKNNSKNIRIIGKCDLHLLFKHQTMDKTKVYLNLEKLSKDQIKSIVVAHSKSNEILYPAMQNSFRRGTYWKKDPYLALSRHNDWIQTSLVRNKEEITLDQYINEILKPEDYD